MAVRQGRATLVIAHRLSTIRGADRIVVLDEGRVVEQGAHDDLLAHSRVYRSLIAAQTEAPNAPPPCRHFTPTDLTPGHLQEPVPSEAQLTEPPDFDDKYRAPNFIIFALRTLRV